MRKSFESATNSIKIRDKGKIILAIFQKPGFVNCALLCNELAFCWRLCFWGLEHNASETLRAKD